MNGVYNASAPPPEDYPSAAEELRTLRLEAATSRLEAAMGRVNELAAQLAEKEADESPLDARDVALLAALTHDEQAPLEWRSLGRRVDDGLTSWDAFWARPQAEAGGLALLAAVMRHTAARTRDVLAQLEDEQPE